LGVTVVLGVILASHLSLGRSVVTLSNRSFYANAALDLAESGVEHAMWALNRANKSTAGAWDDWTVSDGNASRKFEDFQFGAGASGTVNVHVSGYAGATPEVVAKAMVAIGRSGATIEKWLKV